MTRTAIEEKRRDHRFPIDSIRFPFLGTRHADHVCTQYLLIDISAQGLQIAIPKWLVNRERLQEGELFNMHVPFRLAAETFNQGRIVWSRWDETIQGQLCGIVMARKTPILFPLYIEFDGDTSIGIDLQRFDSPLHIFSRLLKDAVLLKKGILIYLNHLIPYFSRIASYPAEHFPQLKELVLDDIKNKVAANRSKIEAIAEEAAQHTDYLENLSKYLDLDELRSVVESEIQYEVLKTALDTDSVLPYLDAIKELEKKLYANYNAIVMLYLRTL